MKRTRHWLRPLAAWAAALAVVAAGDTVTVFSPGDAAAVVAGRMRMLLARDVLDAGVDRRPVAMALLRASPEASAQAMAHAVGAWWVTIPGGFHITRSPHFISPRMATKHFPGGIARPIWLERQVIAVSAPWIGSTGGIAVDPISGTWAASTDQPGLRRLEQLLALLDQQQAVVPIAFQADRPQGQHAAIRVAHWSALPAALVEAGQSAVSVDSELLGTIVDGGLSIPAGPWSALPEVISAVAPGATAAWSHGCLCIGLSAESRIHPAAATTFAVLPISHLRIPAASLAAELRSSVHSARWEQPGWGFVTPPHGKTLIVSADPATIHDVIAELSRRESDAHMLRP